MSLGVSDIVSQMSMILFDPQVLMVSAASTDFLTFPAISFPFHYYHRSFMIFGPSHI